MVCLFQQCKLTSLVVVRWERERSFSCSQRPSLSRSQRHSLVLVLYRLSFPFPAQSQFATLPIPKNSPKLSLELTMQRGLVCNNTKVLPRRPGFQEAFPTSCPATLAQSRLHPVAALSLSLTFSLFLSFETVSRDSARGQKESCLTNLWRSSSLFFSFHCCASHFRGYEAGPGNRLQGILIIWFCSNSCLYYTKGAVETTETECMWKTEVNLEQNDCWVVSEVVKTRPIPAETPFLCTLRSCCNIEL